MNTVWPDRDPGHTGPLLIFLMDPHCGWCFGFHDTIADFSDLHGNLGAAPALRVLPGGLFVPGRQSSPSFADTKRPIAQRVEQRFGVTFSEAYFRNVLGADWLDSDPPGRAIVAAELLDGNPLEFAGVVMDAAFRHGRNISDESILIELAGETGLDKAQFAEALRSVVVRERTDQARELATQAGTGFPSVFLQVAPGQPLRRLGGGELTADDISTALSSQVH